MKLLLTLAIISAAIGAASAFQLLTTPARIAAASASSSSQLGMVAAEIESLKTKRTREVSSWFAVVYVYVVRRKETKP